MEQHSSFSELLSSFGLSREDCGRTVSDAHAECISRKCCKHWKKLPSHLGLDTIVVDDISSGQGDEETKRHNFFLKWKETKGSGATYRALINALLVIDCREDAEKVCDILKDPVGSTSPPSPTQPPPPKRVCAIIIEGSWFHISGGAAN